MFLRKITLTFAVTAMGLFAQTTTTTTTTRDVLLGPVGVGSTETVQINVANLASNSSTGTAASCTGTITFNNAAGNAIGTSTSFTLTAGQISSASLPFSKISSSTARTEVVGFVALTTTTTSVSRAPCDLHYSLETYDTATGATHVFVSSSEGAIGLPGGGFGR